MSKVKIEDYREFEIFFDNEKEVFYTVSNSFDTESAKKSYSAIKAYIDQYIKDNLEFKPVWAQKLGNIFSGDKKIKLIGIRKDKAFVYENEKGEKKQLSIYEEDGYFLCNPDNDWHIEEMNRIESQIAILQKQKKEVESKLIKVPLSEIKSKYTI